jgi:hypothetical protein
MSAENLVDLMRIRGVIAPLYPTTSELAALEQTEAWGLWLDVKGEHLSAAMLGVVLNALRAFEGLIWHVAPVAARATSIASHQRALGRYPGLVQGDLLGRQTVTLSETHWYGDIGVLNPEAAPQLAQLWQRSTAATDSMLAFFRSRDARVRHQWQVALLGALWAWARRQASKPDRQEVDSRRSILQNLVRDVIDADGLLALLADIEESGRIMVLIGREGTCQEVASTIDATGTIEWLPAPSALGRLEWLPWLT